MLASPPSRLALTSVLAALAAAASRAPIASAATQTIVFGSIRPAIRLAALVVFVSAALAFMFQAPSQAMAGQDPGNESGLFVVEDAEAQFDALKHHAEAIGWRNPEGEGAIDPSNDDHYQGLVRNPRRGAPVFYVSQSDDDDAGTAGGYVHVVRFGGGRTTSGERLRSNLQQVGKDTEDASPPAEDRWLRSIRFDGTTVFNGKALPAYKHPGGMAVVDDVLFVPVDQPVSGGAPGFLLMFDVRDDPTNPVPLKAIPLQHGIDNLAVTRRSNDTYLIWTNGDSGKEVHVYHTTVTNLRDDDLGLHHVQPWAPPVQGGPWPVSAGAHQSSTFVREPDGTLFLIGMSHPWGLPFSGSDYVDLYQVADLDSELKLTHLRTRILNCVYDGGGGPVDMRVCNMAAANNAYVSPSGELILYSSPHDDEDGFYPGPDIVRMGEFRHRDVNRAGSPLRSPTANAGGSYEVDEGKAVSLLGQGAPPADRPWVELYDDEGFEDRSIVVDYDDLARLELNNFNKLDDFNDNTSSVRWRSPVGLDIVLYEHDGEDGGFGGRRVILRGTGKTQGISSLTSQVVVPGLVEQSNPAKDAGELDFGHHTSSLKWVGSPPDPGSQSFSWDLDGDDVFGETGDAAANGDETGPTPTFDAARTDGPDDMPVSLRVTYPTATSPVADEAMVHIRNVAPTVSIDSLEGGLAGIALTGLPVALKGSFADIPADTHTAKADWGDGSTAPASVDGSSSTVSATHVYAIEGDLQVKLAVTDDDGGVGTATAALTVLGPTAAVSAAIDEIDALLGGPLDDADRKALERARKRLDGPNGALSRLDTGDKVAALAELEQALAELETVAGVNVTDLMKLLALVANSVAQTTYDEAVADAGPTPTPEEQQKLAEAQGWLTEGAHRLSASELTDAVRAFRFATTRALEVLAP